MSLLLMLRLPAAGAATAAEAGANACLKRWLFSAVDTGVCACVMHATHYITYCPS